jgi:hypothetical protein
MHGLFLYRLHVVGIRFVSGSTGGGLKEGFGDLVGRLRGGTRGDAAGCFKVNAVDNAAACISSHFRKI